MRRFWILLAAWITLSSVAYAQDANRGRLVFNANCAVCHSAAQGAAARLGPNLFGVVGRRAGVAAGFSYSAPMRNSGITWTSDSLQTYLRAPARTVPGTRMAFAGLHNDAQNADIVAYLQTLH